MTANEAPPANEAANEAAPERETMTTGQAAARLGLPVKEVRALCEAGELSFYWSRAHRVTTDVNGHELRGHRWIFAASVAAYARKLAEIAAGGADAKSPSGHS